MKVTEIKKCGTEKRNEHEITLRVLDRLWLLAPKWKDVSVKFYLSVRFVRLAPINFFSVKIFLGYNISWH